MTAGRREVPSAQPALDAATAFDDDGKVIFLPTPSDRCGPTEPRVCAHCGQRLPSSPGEGAAGEGTAERNMGDRASATEAPARPDFGGILRRFIRAQFKEMRIVRF